MAQLPFGYEIENGIATITLDRPDRLNALTFDVYRRLADMFYRMRFADEVKAVVITGSGTVASAADSTVSNGFFLGSKCGPCSFS